MQVLDFNVGIDFGARGNLQEFSPSGFSTPPDQVSTWTEREVAQLLFRVPPLRGNLRLNIQATPFLAARAGVVQQRCWVYCNGLFVHLQTLRAPAEIEFVLQRGWLNERGPNTLAFALPDAVSPNQLRMGGDLRQLGLAIVKLAAAQAEAAGEAGAAARPRSA